jgi:hypothetical protein
VSEFKAATRTIAWGRVRDTWHCAVVVENPFTRGLPPAVRMSACEEVLLKTVFRQRPDEKEGMCPECKARATRFIVEET